MNKHWVCLPASNNLIIWTKYLKQWFSRHWISGSEGQYFTRGRKRMSQVLCLPQLNVVREFPGPGSGRENLGKPRKLSESETNLGLLGGQGSKSFQDWKGEEGLHIGQWYGGFPSGVQLLMET